MENDKCGLQQFDPAQQHVMETVNKVYDKLKNNTYSTSEWNTFRDCEIALGMTDAESATVEEAKRRVLTYAVKVSL